MGTIVELVIKNKEYNKLPKDIAKKLIAAIKMIEEFGISKLRTIRSFNDEKLIGSRFGQRSFRLNRSWRVIYVEKSSGGA